jgi:hypothetical protein
MCVQGRRVHASITVNPQLAMAAMNMIGDNGLIWAVES